MNFIVSFFKFPRVVIVVFFISLCLPAYVYDAHYTTQHINISCGHPFNTALSPEQCKTQLEQSHETQTDWGFIVLLTGFTGMFVGAYAWLSNIFFIVGYRQTVQKKYKEGMAFALCAAVLALQTFFIQPWPLDEGGVMEGSLLHVSVGYYVWIASFLLLAWYAFRQSKLQPVAAVPALNVQSDMPLPMTDNN